MMLYLLFTQLARGDWFKTCKPGIFPLSIGISPENNSNLNHSTDDESLPAPSTSFDVVSLLCKSAVSDKVASPSNSIPITTKDNKDIMNNVGKFSVVHKKGRNGFVEGTGKGDGVGP